MILKPTEGDFDIFRLHSVYTLRYNLKIKYDFATFPIRYFLNRPDKLSTIANLNTK